MRSAHRRPIFRPPWKGGPIRSHPANVPKSSEEAWLTADSGAPLRVLFVEDAFDHALLVKAFLSASGGYEVTHTQDGDQAVRLIEDQEWDLLITDLTLPGADGFEVIRVARAKSPDLRILATTDYTEQEYHDRATSAGAREAARQGRVPRGRQRRPGCRGRAEPGAREHSRYRRPRW
ncbi:MAG TPA: hypothetical protein DC060_07220 [Gemmatimonadetes bacterium]|nr:hypothetical protein [Gemmatimonadota bacterium]HIN49924.1 response regulator [Gemmatimonadota bacterium]